MPFPARLGEQTDRRRLPNSHSAQQLTSGARSALGRNAGAGSVLIPEQATTFSPRPNTSERDGLDLITAAVPELRLDKHKLEGGEDFTSGILRGTLVPYL